MRGSIDPFLELKQKRFFTEYLGVITKGRMMYSVPSVASRSERVRGG